MTIKKEDIPDLIIQNADSTKINVYQKELNEKLRMQINNLTIHLGRSSDIYCDNDKQFEKYINDTLSKIDLEQLRNNFNEVYKTIFNKYLNWDKDYLKFCDGKIALAKFINDFARELEILPKKVEKYIDKLIQNDEECKYEISKLF